LPFGFYNATITDKSKKLRRCNDIMGQIGWILVGIIGVSVIAAVIVAAVTSVIAGVVGSNEDDEA